MANLNHSKKFLLSSQVCVKVQCSWKFCDQKRSLEERQLASLTSASTQMGSSLLAKQDAHSQNSSLSKCPRSPPIALDKLPALPSHMNRFQNESTAVNTDRG